MKAFLIFLIIPVAMGVYTVLATKFAYSARYPLVTYAFVAAALIGLLLTVRSSFSWGGVVWNVLGWVLALGFAYWTLVFSNYDKAEAPGSGTALRDQMSSARLVDASGQPFDLPSILNSHGATLLVFYRGYW